MQDNVIGRTLMVVRNFLWGLKERTEAWQENGLWKKKEMREKYLK
jgi:hypothetical protein